MLNDDGRNPKLKTTPINLSATPNSICSQLLTISGGLLLHPHAEDAPCLADTDTGLLHTR